MSFGFGVGDFLAVGKLAWTLYREGFLVARGAPREFRLLVDELKTLHTMMLAFAEEVENADSILIRAGEDRQKMVKNILNGIEETLSGLNDAFRKHRNLGSTSRSGFKRQWDKFKWAVDASDVDELRNKLTYQNGVLSLLLTCAGNSSLQRIENTTKAIDDGIHQLKGFIQQGRKGSLSPNPPVVSVPCNVDDFDSVAFSEQCMLAAEASQPWTAISIADWIKAGRWWLLRVRNFICDRGLLIMKAYF
ncbi:hypothetical protein BDZ91DRAFT_700866 [Kalaharituber pfeilii]|nr:hypothetical protein BDZ91DRAFT_700866 [Kalaharituber pfeilii]